MKRKNFLFAGIAILACSVFVSSCSKDEDYDGVDYYEDWTPEQFETFASKSVSVGGENDNTKPSSSVLGLERREDIVYFNIEQDGSYPGGKLEQIRCFVNYTVSVIETIVFDDIKSYSIGIDVSDNSDSNVSISAETFSINKDIHKATVNIEYAYSYTYNGIPMVARAQGTVEVDLDY